jgi:uncharacterized protein
MRIVDNLFLWMNNIRTRVSKRRFKAENVLLLLPHCLQLRECEVRLQNDVANCKECGRCKIKEIKELAERRGIKTHIASGGREAQKRAMSKDVHLILAVACSREMGEGVRATFPKKVVGILNSWPKGACISTDVDVAEIETALDQLIEPNHSLQDDNKK